MYTATLSTDASAGYLQVTLARHFPFPMGVGGGRCPSASELTRNRYGSPELRAARDDLRLVGYAAWIEIAKPNG
jgi:hypothetical protein